MRKNLNFQQDRAARAAEQAEVNRVYAEDGAVAAMAEIRRLASGDHAEYPQYVGYWDGPEWTLAKATTAVRSKGGVQVETGDVVLYKRNDRYLGGIVAGRDDLFYSVRLGWNCAASYGLQIIRSRYTGEPVG